MDQSINYNLSIVSNNNISSSNPVQTARKQKFKYKVCKECNQRSKYYDEIHQICHSCDSKYKICKECYQRKNYFNEVHQICHSCDANYKVCKDCNQRRKHFIGFNKIHQICHSCNSN